MGLRSFLAVAIGALLLAAVPAAAQPARQAPPGLAFYKPPKHLPSGHGKIIWTRKLRGGYETLYVAHVLQADRGADFDFLVGCRGHDVPRESH